MFDHPWLVGGGVAHPAEVARLLAYASTGGAEGIVTPGDLKVRPLSTPGTKIRVAPGAALMVNKYPGGGQQTYAARSPIQQEVSVTATGSSGARSDLVIARVLDPQYEGQPPSDPQEFQYARIEIVEGVPANTKSALDLNLTYPAIALARLDLPKSTGTIQAEHVTDVRAMAQPRKDRHLFVYPIVQADGELPLTQTAEHGMGWPSTSISEWRVDVPEWAQRARILASWAAVKINGNAKDAWGHLWVQLGGTAQEGWIKTQDTAWNIPSNYKTMVRETWIAGDDRYIPPVLRGRDLNIYLRGRVRGSDSQASKPVLDMYSVVSLDIEFYETRS